MYFRTPALFRLTQQPLTSDPSPLYDHTSLYPLALTLALCCLLLVVNGKIETS